MIWRRTRCTRCTTRPGTAPDGARPLLLLLHGGDHTVGLRFSAVLPTPAADRRVVAPELQGPGHTAGTGREMTVPGLASDVVVATAHPHGAVGRPAPPRRT
jgi:pimeloyl-ACP methyl ester carboxylesterase